MKRFLPILLLVPVALICLAPLVPDVRTHTTDFSRLFLRGAFTAAEGRAILEITNSFGTHPVDLASDVTGNLAVTNLNGGTNAAATTYWSGVGTWTIPGGSSVSVTNEAGKNFDLWFTNSTGQMVMVQASISLTSYTTNECLVELEVDEDADGTADYTHPYSVNLYHSDSAVEIRQKIQTHCLVPDGGAYRWSTLNSDIFTMTMDSTVRILLLP